MMGEKDVVGEEAATTGGGEGGGGRVRFVRFF